MSSKPEIWSADVCPGDDAYALATSASSRRLEIPAAMIGKYCWFTAETITVYVRFGDDEVDVASSAVSTVDAEVLTVEGSEPHITIEAGQTVHWRLQGTWTHMADIAADTSGKLRFGLAQGEFGAD